MLPRMQLPTGVHLDPHPSGLARLRIETATCRAELFLHGATLTAWAPHGHRDVLFTSPRAGYRADKAIRGGVPICLPWFGPREGHPQHGFARTSAWRLVSATDRPDHHAVELELALDEDGARPDFPHAFAARYTVTLGAALECALAVTNTGGAPFTYTDALHAYFAVDDIHTVRVRGLEGAPYLDRRGGGSIPSTSEPEPFALTEETDRTYPRTAAPVDILDGDRTITVTKAGAQSTVVWNPWRDKAAAIADLGDEAWARMICVEPANALDEIVALAPGETHATRMRVVVVAGV